MSIAIIDYGMGNLASVQSACESISAPSFITENPEDLKKAAHIIVPGVGSFAQAMENLRSGGWVKALRQASDENIPILGICLGMQLLAARGTEHGESEGLGLIPGVIRHFSDPDPIDQRIPHVGWNEIHIQKQDYLFAGVKDKTDFYFVHSYIFHVDEPAHVLTTTPHGREFTSTVGAGSVRGVQFHPEKSGPAGFQILKNFVGGAAC